MNNKCQFLKVAVSLFLLSSYAQAEILIKDGNMDEFPDNVSMWRSLNKSHSTLVEKITENSNTVLHVVTPGESDTSLSGKERAGVMQSLGHMERPISLKISFRYKVTQGKNFGVAVGNGRLEEIYWELNAMDWEKCEHVFVLKNNSDIQASNTSIYFIERSRQPTEFYIDDVSVEVLEN